MKTIFAASVVAACMVASAYGQEKKPTKVVISETSNLTSEEIRAEYEFLADPDSPKLYPMDKALEVAKLSNKPVLCWMGEHVFANENARKLSQELKATTIQASMANDSDNPKYDKFNPRVKFNTSQYVNGGKTYFIRAADFKFEGPSVRKEDTTGYKIMAMIDSKAQPAGTDPLSGEKTGK